MTNIIETSILEAKKNNSKRIINITLEIGSLSGVEINAIEFAFNSFKSEELIKDAELSIIEVKGKLFCYDCKIEYNANDLYTLCPKCSGYNCRVVEGKELKIKSLTLI